MADDKNWFLALGNRQGEKPLPFEGKKGNPMEEIKEGIQMVQATKKVADELSGADILKNELEQTRAELEKQKMEVINKELAEIKVALKAATEQRDIPAIKELEHKLEEARDIYHKEQLESLRKEIAQLHKPGEKGVGDIAEEIKKIKEASKELGLTSGVSTTPPDILIELQRMDHDFQLKLEEMKDERGKRDKEWQLTLKKWEDEKELRLSAAQQKYEVDKDRTEALKSAFDRGARIIGRAMTEEEGGTPAGTASAYHIEAGEGEIGEFDCPKCRTPVVVAPDATRAVCAKCGFSASIKRVKKVEPEKQVA